MGNVYLQENRVKSREKYIYPGKFKQESGFIVIRMMFNKTTFDIILTTKGKGNGLTNRNTIGKS